MEDLTKYNDCIKNFYGVNSNLNKYSDSYENYFYISTLIDGTYEEEFISLERLEYLYNEYNKKSI